MFNSQLLDKYQPPRNQAPSKVRRFPLYRRPAPKPPSPAPPPTKDPPKEEQQATPPPVWSDWQLIKEPQWEGYWRASAQEDGGWHYHFTKDGKTIWEQTVPKPEAPKPSKTLAKTDAIVKPATPSALKQPHPPTSLAKRGHHSVKTVVPAPPKAPPAATSPPTVAVPPTTAQTTAKVSVSTMTTRETIPSFTVKKPEPPKPPAPPKRVAGTITLHTKTGKAVTLPLPDSGKPVVIRTLLEK